MTMGLEGERKSFFLADRGLEELCWQEAVSHWKWRDAKSVMQRRVSNSADAKRHLERIQHGLAVAAASAALLRDK
jgi:hypothetical protein